MSRLLKSLKSLFDVALGEYDCVFYAESRHDWKVIKHVLLPCTKLRDRKVLLLTSYENMHKEENLDIDQKYIGFGPVRALVFQIINCRFFFLTLPDLETLELKKSRVKSIKYIYFFHSTASTHMNYREDAFDFFDVVLTVGPYHEREIRKREELKNLSKKKLVPFGYPMLNELINYAGSYRDQAIKGQVLLAPSWGDNCLKGSSLIVVINSLIEEGFCVLYRPHPMSVKLNPNVLEDLLGQFDSKLFRIDENPSLFKSFKRAECLVCDWGGIPIEFGISFMKPIIYIDTPRKVNNINYKVLEIEPIEVYSRDELGKVVAIENLESIGKVVNNEIAESKKRDNTNFIEENFYNISRNEICFTKILKEMVFESEK